MIYISKDEKENIVKILHSNLAASQILVPKGNQLQSCVFFQPDYMYIYSSQYSTYMFLISQPVICYMYYVIPHFLVLNNIFWISLSIHKGLPFLRLHNILLMDITCYGIDTPSSKDEHYFIV